MRYRLGSIDQHTVYEGELVSLGLGAELLQKETRITTVSLYSDNQAGIQAIGSFKSSPGHYLIDAFLKQIHRIVKKYPHCVITVRWVPGHKGVQGNEVADEIAKEAASSGSSYDKVLPSHFRSNRTLPASKSAMNQAFYAGLNVKNSELFSSSPRCNTLRQIDESAPSNKF